MKVQIKEQIKQLVRPLMSLYSRNITTMSNVSITQANLLQLLSNSAICLDQMAILLGDQHGLSFDSLVQKIQKIRNKAQSPDPQKNQNLEDNRNQSLNIEFIQRASQNSFLPDQFMNNKSGSFINQILRLCEVMVNNLYRWISANDLNLQSHKKRLQHQFSPHHASIDFQKLMQQPAQKRESNRNNLSPTQNSHNQKCLSCQTVIQSIRIKSIKQQLLSKQGLNRHISNSYQRNNQGHRYEDQEEDQKLEYLDPNFWNFLLNNDYDRQKHTLYPKADSYLTHWLAQEKLKQNKYYQIKAQLQENRQNIGKVDDQMVDHLIHTMLNLVKTKFNAKQMGGKVKKLATILNQFSNPSQYSDKNNCRCECHQKIIQLQRQRQKQRLQRQKQKQKQKQKTYRYLIGNQIVKIQKQKQPDIKTLLIQDERQRQKQDTIVSKIVGMQNENSIRLIDVKVQRNQGHKNQENVNIKTQNQTKKSGNLASQHNSVGSNNKNKQKQVPQKIEYQNMTKSVTNKDRIQKQQQKHSKIVNIKSDKNSTKQIAEIGIQCQMAMDQQAYLEQISQQLGNQVQISNERSKKQYRRMSNNILVRNMTKIHPRNNSMDRNFVSVIEHQEKSVSSNQATVDNQKIQNKQSKKHKIIKDGKLQKDNPKQNRKEDLILLKKDDLGTNIRQKQHKSHYQEQRTPSKNRKTNKLAKHAETLLKRKQQNQCISSENYRQNDKNSQNSGNKLSKVRKSLFKNVKSLAQLSNLSKLPKSKNYRVSIMQNLKMHSFNEMNIQGQQNSNQNSSNQMKQIDQQYSRGGQNYQLPDLQIRNTQCPNTNISGEKCKDRRLLTQPNSKIQEQDLKEKNNEKQLQNENNKTKIREKQDSKKYLYNTSYGKRNKRVKQNIDEGRQQVKPGHQNLQINNHYRQFSHKISQALIKRKNKILKSVNGSIKQNQNISLNNTNSMINNLNSAITLKNTNGSQSYCSNQKWQTIVIQDRSKTTKKQITQNLFIINDLQLFGGVSQSIKIDRQFNSKLCNSKSNQNRSCQSNSNFNVKTQMNQTCTIQNLEKEKSLQNSDTSKAVLRNIKNDTNTLIQSELVSNAQEIKKHIMILSMYRARLYQTTISFLCHPYETVSIKKVVKIETTTEQITNILARVLRLHQKQCGSFNCAHVWAFLTKIMYGQPNFGYDFANSSDLDKSLNRHKYSMSIDNLGGIFNINHQTSHEQINKNSNCSHENNVQNK